MTAGKNKRLSRTTASLWASSATWQWWESSAPAWVSPPWQCHSEVGVWFSAHHHCCGFSSSQIITKNLDVWQVDSHTPSISQAVCTSGNGKDLSFMSYPPAVFSCHCIPASTAQQTRLWQAKFFCHHFLPPLPVLFLPVTVQPSSVTSSEEECCSVLIDQTLECSTPLPCNNWRAIKGRVQCISEHETLSGDVSPGPKFWLPGQNFALLPNFTALELLSFFLSTSSLLGKASGTKYQFTTTCQSLQTVVICDPVLPNAALVHLCPCPYRKGEVMCIYKKSRLGEHNLV